MSARTNITRSAAAAVALGGALALTLPGVASAEDADAYPAPTVSAEVDGNDVITTITDNGEAAGGATCLNAGLLAVDALPFAGGGDLPPFSELLELTAWIGGTPTEEGAPTSTDAENPTITVDSGELEPGAYATVGACVADGEVASYAYQVVFVPGGFGSIGQALDLGSAVAQMDNGSAIISDLLTSGTGSEMLGDTMS